MMDSDDGPCTDCWDTGLTTQTERPCSCDAGDQHRAKPAPPMTDDLVGRQTDAEVAAKLTKAQRNAMVWLASGNIAASDAWHGHSKEQPTRPTLNRLVAHGLAEIEQGNSYWNVTASASGLRVAQHLKQENAK